MNTQELIFALVMMHFLCDYPLQGDFIGKFKNRHAHWLSHPYIKLADTNPVYANKCDFILDHMYNSPASDVIRCNKSKTEHMINVGVPWWHLMAAHSFIHGGGVFLLTGSLLLGLMETVFHFAIDCLKCENKISIHTDQLLHIWCKTAWVMIYALN